MGMVRFATVCDATGCTARSEEYSAFPTCEDCGEFICLEHMVPWSATEDERNECLCLKCQVDRVEEAAESDWEAREAMERPEDRCPPRE